MPYADPLDPRARVARLKHYRSNKAQYIARNEASRLRCAAIMREAKDCPCQDCNESYPSYVMDFDHRDPKQKTGFVGKMARYGEKRLREEIAKCDVVCANCHRERTHGE